MSYCPNCGNEINENAAYCGNCGKHLNGENQNKAKSELVKSGVTNNSYGSKIAARVKKYLLNYYIDYNSLAFAFAMIMFLTVGIGGPLYSIIYGLLPSNTIVLSSMPFSVYRLIIYVVLFVVFALLILKLKDNKTIKKSNSIRVFWLVTLILNILVYIAGASLYDYIFYSNFAQQIIKLLTVVSTVLLLYKNKPKYPIVLFTSALSFALIENGLSWFRTNLLLYKIYHTFDSFIDLFSTYSLGYILLTVVLFGITYFIPKKASKWLVIVPSIIVFIPALVNLFGIYSFKGIIHELINIINIICIIVVLILFALSSSRKIKYDYIIVNKEKSKKSVVMVGVVSLISAAFITLSYLLISAGISTAYINNAIEKWNNKLTNGYILSVNEWNELNSDIFNPYYPSKIASHFIDKHYIYETLEDYRYSNIFKNISECYTAYKSGVVDEDVANKYSKININESWADNPILSPYYKVYLEMKPDIKNVFASAQIYISAGKIYVTIENRNNMPISKCTVTCNFTIGFIESGYYSGIEYGRGTKTITIENISGKDKKRKHSILMLTNTIIATVLI